MRHIRKNCIVPQMMFLEIKILVRNIKFEN